MKKYELQKAVAQTVQNPMTAFALGALCGLTIGMLFLPFSKGIVIRSYNEDSHVERDHIATVPDEE